jgi:hypothetical protein
MAVMLIAHFDGDMDQLRRAYDRAHALIMSRGGATGAGELRDHCAIGEGALYIIGVWESEERIKVAVPRSSPAYRADQDCPGVRSQTGTVVQARALFFEVARELSSCCRVPPQTVAAGHRVPSST